MNFTCHTTKKGTKVSNPLNTPRSLLHPRGVVGPARVRAFTGTGLPKTTRGTRAPARALVLLCALLGVLAFSAVPASAARGHVPQSSFGQEGSGAGELKEPMGLAVNESTGQATSGDVYVADYGNNRVQWFSFDAGTKKYEVAGQITAADGSGTGTLTVGSPTIEAVAVTLGSGVFVVGQSVSGAGVSGEAKIPVGAKITGVNLVAGTIEISSPVEGKAGAVESMVGLTAEQPLVKPQAIAVDNDPASPSFGDVYVTSGDVVGVGSGAYPEHVVDKFSPAGVFVGQIATTPELSVRPEPLERSFWAIEGLAVDQAGGLWFYEENEFDRHTGVDHFTSAEPNEWMGFQTIHAVEYGFVHGLARDSKGDLYLRDYEHAGEVAEYAANGELLNREVGGDPSSGVVYEGVAAETSTNDVYVDEASTIARFGPVASGNAPEVERFGSGVLPSAGCENERSCRGGLAVDSATGQVFAADFAGVVHVFALEEPAAPLVTNGSLTNVTDSSATLNAEVNPRSLTTEHDDTEWFVEYGPCASPSSCASSPYTEKTPVEAIAPDFEEHAVSALAQGLSADTPYHFRVVASNERGPAYGTEVQFSTRATGPFGLPDNRTWEMVSPPQKEGALIEPIEGAGDFGNGVIQAAASGDAMTYLTNEPTESGPQGYSNFVQVLSTRGAGGWSSSDLTLPHTAATGLSAGVGEEYRFFSEDLSHAVVQPFGAFVRSVSEEASEQTALLRTNYRAGEPGEPCTPASMSCFRPLVTDKEGYANDTTKPFQPFGEACTATLICGPVFMGGTADLSHVVLSSLVKLAPGGGGEGFGKEGLYEWNAGEPPAEQLKPVSLLPPNGGGEELPALKPLLGFSFFNDVRDAISSDGSRVFWSSSGQHLYMRDTAKGKTIQLDVPQPECEAKSECGEGAIDAEFQQASSNGNVVFFLDTQKLTANAAAYGDEHAGMADLYECEMTEDVCSLKDLTPSGAVMGRVVGASEDGSWVYFVADGVLAPGAVPGSCPNLSYTNGTAPHVLCNLYVRHGGVTSLVAVLSGEEPEDWRPLFDQMTARVSPDGRYVAFMSQRSLTGYDNADAASGVPDQEVYLYHAPENLATQSGSLVCASCNPTGARPHGVKYSTADTPHIPLAAGQNVWEPATWLAANVPSWTRFGNKSSLYQSRYLSNNGRLFFNSSDALVPKDGNGTEDVYEYEPQGVPEGEHVCTSSSASGSDVFKPGQTVTVEKGTPQEREVHVPAGCVALISSGESAQESAFLDASEGGGDVFFLTQSKLAPQDTDNALDIYDAQECTTLAPCPPQPAQSPAPCNTEASCKAAPSSQPAIFGPTGSATFSGPGNLAPPAIKTVTKKKTSACKKGYVKKKVKQKEQCVKKPKPKKRVKKKPATTRGASN
jgi:hypothetical protein